MKRTTENIQKLAEKVLDSWDMDTLMCAMLDRLIKDYQEDEKLFQYDSELMEMEEHNG